MTEDFSLWESLSLASWLLPLPLLFAAQSGRKTRWKWFQAGGLASMAALEVLAQGPSSSGIAAMVREHQSALEGAFYALLVWSMAEALPGQWRDRAKWIRRSRIGAAIVLCSALVCTLFSGGAGRSWVVVWALLPSLLEIHGTRSQLPLWRKLTRYGAAVLFPISLAFPPIHPLFAVLVVLNLLADGTAAIRADARAKLQRSREALQPKALQEMLAGTAGPRLPKDEESLSLERMQALLTYAIQATGAAGGAVYIYREDKVKESGTLSRRLKCASSQGCLETLQHENVALPAQIMVARLEANQATGMQLDPKNNAEDAFICQVWGVSGLAVAPIRNRGRCLGVVAVVPENPRIPFSPQQRQLLEFLGLQAAFSLHYDSVYHQLIEESRLTREFEIAARIQRGLLPKAMPSCLNLSVAARILPAREVGGDYFDLLPLPDGRLLAVIGDVSGKGLPAGMIMLIVRTILHVLVDTQPQPSPAWVIKNLEDKLVPQLDAFTFMTFLALRWSGKDRQLLWTGAGHEHLLWLSSLEGQVHRIRSGGLALGLRRDGKSVYEERRLSLSPGDVVILYTDGVTDCRSPDGQSFGLTRLEAALKNYAGLEPEEILDAIEQEIETFRASTPPADDRTLLILKAA